jgi:hypothetical protein
MKSFSELVIFFEWTSAFIQNLILVNPKMRWMGVINQIINVILELFQ